MIKAEFIKAVAERSGKTQVYVEDVMEAMQAVVKEEINLSGKLTLTGLGTFSLANRAARKGRNPRNGQTIPIPAKKSVKFKPSAEWRRELN